MVQIKGSFLHKIQSFYKPRNIQHAPHFFPHPLFIFFHSEFAVIYYINLACTTLLLSKISPTLHHTFNMHHTFYIMIYPTPHFLHPLLYYSCTTFSSAFYILHHTLGGKFKVSYIFKHIYFTKAIFTNNILNILFIHGLFG